MFLCCFPNFRGSGLKKTRSERCFCCCRNWRKRHHRHRSSSGTRHPQALSLQSSEDAIEELADGFTYAINRYKGQGRQARKAVPSRAENSNEDIVEVLDRGPNYTTYRVRVQVHQAYDAGQCQLECAAQFNLNLHEAVRMRALQEGTLEKVVASMVPAFPCGKIPHVSTFMAIHPAFSRAQQFLDQLFTRYCPPFIRSDAIQVFSTSGNILPYSDQGDTAQDQVKKAIASMVGIWPDQVQNFGQPLRFPGFEVKPAFVQVNFPASYQVGYTHLLWVELEHLEPAEAELEEPTPELQRAPEPEEEPARGRAPGPAIGPAPARGPAPAWPGLKQYLKPLWRWLLSALKALSLAVLRVLSNYPK